jgi:hypothetical protein
MIWKLNHVAGIDQVVAARDSVPAWARFASGHTRRPWFVVTRNVLSKRRAVRPTLTRSGVAKALRDRKGCWSDPVALCGKWLLQTRLQSCSIHPRQLSCKPASLSGEASLYLPHHRALPRLSSVTESIALPPRPKGGQDVKYQQIQHSRVARAPGTAAGLFCVVGRRCDAYSVVVHLGGSPP